MVDLIQNKFLNYEERMKKKKNIKTTSTTTGSIGKERYLGFAFQSAFYNPKQVKVSSFL